MIVELLLSSLYNLFFLLSKPIDIPNFPNEVSSMMNEAMSYLSAGGGILANYVNLEYLLILLGLIVAIDIGVGLYHFIMWIVRKIPVAGVS